MALKNNIENNIAKQQVEIADFKIAAYQSNYFPKVSAKRMYLYNDATLGRTITGSDIYNMIPDAIIGIILEGCVAVVPDIPLEFILNETYNGSVEGEQA